MSLLKKKLSGEKICDKIINNISFALAEIHVYFTVP